MQKYVFFLMALFSLSVQAARANWNPYYMDHERFVHLSQPEKEEILKKTMEMMVELEQKYNKEVITSGYSPVRMRQFVEVFVKLQNFLISDAVADAKDPLTLAKNFAKLLETLGSKGCVYGGYVSKIVLNAQKQKVCTSPAMLPAGTPENDAIKAAYVKSPKAECAAPAHISCNPVVFGYQKASEPICVPTGAGPAGAAHNVSYACMVKSLGEGKEARLDAIASSMAANPVAFNKVHNFIFRTCACGDSTIEVEKTDASGKITKEKKVVMDQDYKNYARPHRTCFGMMNTLREFKNKNDCSAITSISTEGFADQWSQYFGKQGGFSVLPAAKSADWDVSYKSLIDQKAVQALCADKPAVVPVREPAKAVDPECKVQCVKEKDGVMCTVTEVVKTKIVDGKEVKETIKLFEKNKIPLKEGETSISIVSQETKEVLVCPASAPADKATCEIAPKDAEDGKKTDFTLTLIGVDAKAETEIVWSGATVDPKIKTSASVARGAEDIVVSAKVTVKDAKEPLACDSKALKLDAPKQDYKITAKGTPGEKSVPMVAEVTVMKEGKPEVVKLPLAGHHISWTREGSGKDLVTEDAPAGETVVATTGVTDDAALTDIQKKAKADADAKIAADKKKIDGAKKIEGEVKTGDKIDEPRVAQAYSSCASLIEDASKKVVAKAACIPVPPLEGPKLPPLPNGQQMPQNMPASFMKPDQNTRAIGF